MPAQCELMQKIAQTKQGLAFKKKRLPVLEQKINNAESADESFLAEIAYETRFRSYRDVGPTDITAIPPVRTVGQSSLHALALGEDMKQTRLDEARDLIDHILRLIMEDEAELVSLEAQLVALTD
ncbi:hypothetical protein BGZ54_002894 [Gamsiella multidivaricata]|nr:hypothetical protein BGZ54_002894 [Gamsiella multidivaricata]